MTNEEKLKTVPFGNSQFQIMQFIANQESPERSYRNVLLQWDTKNKAMKECYFQRKRKEIDIEEIKEKLLSATGYEKARLEIDLEEAEYQLNSEIKIIEDCVIEIKTYEAILNTLPEFTRKEFEQAELGYWKQRLINQGVKETMSRGTIETGTLQALDQLGITIGKNEKGQLIITEDRTDQIKQLEIEDVK